MRTWGSQAFTQYGYCNGSGMNCSSLPYLYVIPTQDRFQNCANDDACGDGSMCYSFNNHCWAIIPYLRQPRFLPAPEMPSDDPIVSISAGPFMAATWATIGVTGWPVRYRWEPIYSVTWGYNQHGETGRGPGGSSTCYHVSTSVAPQDCYRSLDEVVDDDTNPFLVIEKGRGIGAPPQDGVMLNPPPIKGELNVWGLNDAGQLGLGYDAPGQVSEPELVPEFPLP